MANREKIALLIDCDNISHNAIEGVIGELSKQGVVNIRHAHGDWNNQHLKSWIDKLHPHSIRPMQQFAYTSNKNATDAAIIIDAMDLLHNDNIDAFALMSSDSDFTPLVLRIHEAGLPVYGFGEKKTPEPFVNACSSFIFIENLMGNSKEQKDEVRQSSKKNRKELRQDTSLVKLLRTAVEQTAEDDGWVALNKVGIYISNNSTFSPRNYGYRKLGELVKVSELFEIKLENNNTAMYIKDTHISSIQQ